MSIAVPTLHPVTNSAEPSISVRLLLDFAECIMSAGQDLSILSKAQLQILCNARRIRLDDYRNHMADMRRTRELLQRDYEERHIYDHFDQTTLRQFVHQRGLQTWPTRASDCIRALELADQAGHFRFMDLPPELRIHVYELVFANGTFAERSHVHAIESGHNGYGYGPAQAHALMCVSRFVHNESAPIFKRVRRVKMLMNFCWPDFGSTVQDFIERWGRLVTNMFRRALTPRYRSYGIEIPSVMQRDGQECGVLLHLQFRSGTKMPDITILPVRDYWVLRATERAAVERLCTFIVHSLKTRSKVRVAELLQALCDSD